MVHPLHLSESNEWNTPPQYISMVREVFGGTIDLDPASNAIAQQWISAISYYTIADNGLNFSWEGKIWLNPPYGIEIPRFIDKLLAEYHNGNIEEAIVLVRPSISSAWYHLLVEKFAHCQVRKRIRFIRPDGTESKAPAHGNVFFYLGTNLEGFYCVFSKIGTVCIPYRR